MNKTVIEVQVRAVLPTSGGCAVFLGNNDKVFIIYVDQTVGSAITMFMRDVSKERPLTHDLMGHLMTALGAKVERVIINDLKNATYYARMIIRAENELQQKKIIELDGRPSDCIAMATQQKAPMYVSQEVWDEVDDMSDVLRKMEEDGLKRTVGRNRSPKSTEEDKLIAVMRSVSGHSAKQDQGRQIMFRSEDLPSNSPALRLRHVAAPQDRRRRVESIIRPPLLDSVCVNFAPRASWQNERPAPLQSSSPSKQAA